MWRIVPLRLLVCPILGGGTPVARVDRMLFLTTMLPGARVTGSEVVSSTFIESIRGAGPA